MMAGAWQLPNRHDKARGDQDRDRRKVDRGLANLTFCNRHTKRVQKSRYAQPNRDGGAE